MAEKAFYNIQNDVMDNNQISLIREVEKSIHRSYQENSDEQAIALLNAFVNIVKAKCSVIIPVECTDDLPEDWVGLNQGDEFTLKDDVRFVPKTIETKPDENGKTEEYMVAYTNLEESFCGPETNTCTVKIGNFLNTVLFKDDVEGIIINPFGDESFRITKDMIKELFVRCVDLGPCKADKYYDEHKEENESAKGIDLKDVLSYASEVYKNQCILTTDTPLLVQSMGTASLISDITGGPELILAGLLAKAVNEELANLDDIKERFGLRAAQLLSSQTEDKTMPWYIRKLQYLDDISKSDDIEVKVLAFTSAVSELRSIRRECIVDDTILLVLDAPAEYMKWYYKELCKIFSLYAYEPLSEHIYSEMVALYKKVFMNV